MVTPSGEWSYLPSPYGFHSKAISIGEPSPLSREEAIKQARELLALARKYDPFAAYPDVEQLV
jgi:hypothetical protein